MIVICSLFYCSDLLGVLATKQLFETSTINRYFAVQVDRSRALLGNAMAFVFYGFIGKTPIFDYRPIYWACECLTIKWCTF